MVNNIHLSEIKRPMTPPTGGNGTTNVERNSMYNEDFSPIATVIQCKTFERVIETFVKLSNDVFSSYGRLSMTYDCIGDKPKCYRRKGEQNESPMTFQRFNHCYTHSYALTRIETNTGTTNTCASHHKHHMAFEYICVCVCLCYSISFVPMIFLCLLCVDSKCLAMRE